MKLSKAFVVGFAAVIASSAMAEHTCKIKDEKVYCWGANTHGQLGDEGRGGAKKEADAQALSLGADFVPVAVGTGAEGTCALSKAGRVKCWGGNLYGQLGLEASGTLGGAANEMGDKLPYIRFGKDEVATLLAVGADHVCVALQSGGVKCWGHNDAEQLDVGDKIDRGGRRGDMGDKLSKVKRLGNKKIVALKSAPTADATCAKEEKATDWTCWGDERHFKRVTE